MYLNLATKKRIIHLDYSFLTLYQFYFAGKAFTLMVWEFLTKCFMTEMFQQNNCDEVKKI